MGSSDQRGEAELADLIRQAVFASNSGDYAESYRRLDELQRRFPDSVEPLRWKGNLLDLEALEEMEKLGEEDVSADARLAEARRCYERILELHPNDAIALVDLGEDDERRGAFDQALERCDRALDLLNQGIFVHDVEAELESAYVLKIRALRELGRSDEGDTVRTEALKRLPNSPQLRHRKSD